MNRKITTKAIAVILAMLTAFIAPLSVTASAASAKGKYISDVFIATGDDRGKAKQWLIDHDWEPIADLNEDKTSQASWYDDSIAYLGIKRTNDPNDAITDMATMNQLGDGYSFDDYEALVKQKKADINEFIMTFIPALEEYRANYNGKGSEGGQKRAQYAHDLLNKFFDGDPDGEYAINDTGKPLGDLFLNKTKTEIGDEAYEKLSKEEKMNVADLQQIILESTGLAITTIEKALALATDASEDSWLDRLDTYTGTDLADRIGELVPEAANQDLAPSAALGVLAEHYEDPARILAEQWTDIHENILWFEEYSQNIGVLDEDGEAAENSAQIMKDYFADLQETDAERYDLEYERYLGVSGYYLLLKDINYSGDWGSTLYDLFRPEDEDEDYSEELEYFAPIAVALSKGQRAALELLPFTALIKLGINSDEAMEAEFPSIDELFKDAESDSISIYSGMNRGIFRRGVAVTSKARMQKRLGRDPYEDVWEEGGLVDIISFSTFVAGASIMIAGSIMTIKSLVATHSAMVTLASDVAYYSRAIVIDKFEALMGIGHFAKDAVESGMTASQYISNTVRWANNGLELSQKTAYEAMSKVTTLGSAGKILMGAGGALMIAAAALKAAQLVNFYDRTFSQIPIMIVDEADIVTYSTDENGKQKQTITFDQFAYYEVVKCNRQEIGIHDDAQKGVEKYKEWGCGDAADLNGDVGKEWLAMYVNKSSAKGDPILADSLTRVYGDVKKPKNSNGFLHMFCSSAPTLLDDTAYCYRNDSKKGGMYLYWQTDENAFTASSFNFGYLALAGIGGLGLGILGTTLVILPKRKKESKGTPATV